MCGTQKRAPYLWWTIAITTQLQINYFVIFRWTGYVCEKRTLIMKYVSVWDNNDNDRKRHCNEWMPLVDDNNNKAITCCFSHDISVFNYSMIGNTWMNYEQTLPIALSNYIAVLSEENTFVHILGNLVLITKCHYYLCICEYEKKDKEFKILQGHEHDVIGVQFIFNRSKIISYSNDSTIRIWDLLSGKQLQVLNFSSPVFTANFSFKKLST
ncbi:hypothetical protein RFI_16010 [Reticulomyxa filosa]|uniref:Uncharacterized protein n=1 Tax=Reticulomyxa filosa TaxID=46433 RepID=X6N609_RETFI|nr:hypothetical protein RFI_16010 [Reticulomyxa filosa]|eukprot:ETO21194.1 hypothetical protein RFI_16010 [Reticulomyxa filosa]